MLYRLSNDSIKKAIAIDLSSHQPTISIRVLNDLSNVALKKLQLDANTLQKVIHIIQNKTNVVPFDIDTI